MINGGKTTKPTLHPKHFASFQSKITRDEMLKLLDIQIEECKTSIKFLEEKSWLSFFQDGAKVVARLIKVRAKLKETEDIKETILDTPDNPIEVTIKILEQGT